MPLINLGNAKGQGGGSMFDKDSVVAPNKLMLKNMVEMGFDEDLAALALMRTHNKTIDLAINFIYKHPDLEQDVEDGKKQRAALAQRQKLQAEAQRQQMGKEKQKQGDNNQTREVVPKNLVMVHGTNKLKGFTSEENDRFKDKVRKEELERKKKEKRARKKRARTSQKTLSSGQGCQVEKQQRKDNPYAPIILIFILIQYQKEEIDG